MIKSKQKPLVLAMDICVFIHKIFTVSQTILCACWFCWL